MLPPKRLHSEAQTNTDDAPDISADEGLAEPGVEMGETIEDVASCEARADAATREPLPPASRIQGQTLDGELQPLTSMNPSGETPPRLQTAAHGAHETSESPQFAADCVETLEALRFDEKPNSDLFGERPLSPLPPSPHSQASKKNRPYVYCFVPTMERTAVAPVYLVSSSRKRTVSRPAPAAIGVFELTREFDF